MQEATSTQDDEDDHRDHHRHEDVNPCDETIPNSSSSSEEKRTSYDTITFPKADAAESHHSTQFWRALTTALTKTIISLESEITQKDSK